ncbi:MAG: hypothetical protein C3F06_08220 [Candidatus Methanoperedenaceae archaeon]|nr:MAG: hypothetical protein C3F06_08220 [Candidatus Methanoperedenaceae archaeon]
MDDRNYFLAMLATWALLIVSIVYIAQTTDAFTPLNKSASQEVKIPEFEVIPEQAIDCRICHKNPETLFKHINGGNYCSACHGLQVHDLHNKENGPDCMTCHIDNGKIPGKLPGHTIVCDSCHGYPDALSPSFGNLITIHVARGHPCDTCHIQDIASLHKVESR